MLNIQTKGMSQLKPMIIVLLMLTSALAGCTGTDTTDLEQQIADLQQSNDDLQTQLEERNTEIAILNSNVAMLQSSITDAESYRDSLLVLLENSNTSNDELETMIEVANISILALQSDLVVQQDLVAQWQQTAEDNRADLTGVQLIEANLYDVDLSNANLTDANLIGAYLGYANLSNANLYDADLVHTDLTGADLSGADLTAVYWWDTTCPDGTNSDDNGYTCEDNLVLYSDWLFIGDSDIEEWDTSQFIDSSNIGDGGSTCNDTLSSIDEVLEQYTPVHVVIVCGENDLSEERTVEETFEDFQDIVNKIIESGASVTYMGTKPEPGTTELHTQYRDYDSRIQDFAENLANDSYSPLNVVDVYQGFEDIGNPNSLYQDDELHLSLEGYGYWNQWLVQVSNNSECIIWQSQECRVSIE
jgi:uncharacterized protein YjbI with pentapeptide repeats/lysophospholipase L1-like esterase